MENLETINTLNTSPATLARTGLRLCSPEHPVSVEQLDRFAAGSATRTERSLVIRHLLTGCASCSRHLGRDWPQEAPQLPEDAYDQAFERSLERVLETLQIQRSAA